MRVWVRVAACPVRARCRAAGRSDAEKSKRFSSMRQPDSSVLTLN
ncbi:hypothetical protein ATKI12_8442 [Kitasatospora sp. Ki12]